MTSYEIAHRYSKALMNLCASNEQMEKWAKDLKTLHTALKHTPKWKYFFSIPQIPIQEKEQVISKALGENYDKKLQDFLFFLLKKGRFTYLSDIVKDFERRTAAHVGVKQAYVITAVPLEAKAKETLQNKLENFYNYKIQLIEKKDPSILGGVILVIGNKIIDHSIRNRLDNLEEYLESIR